MFDWIGDFVGWVLQFFPHMIVVRHTHRVVKFVKGKDLVLVEPGLCWYWPLVTDIMELAVARRTIRLPIQRLTTEDGKRVVASAFVVFHVNDPIKAVGKTWDFDDTIADVAMGSIAGIVTQQDFRLTLDTLETTTADVMKKACRAELQKYGVTVQQCQLKDFCEADVMALSHSGSLQNLFTEDDE